MSFDKLEYDREYQRQRRLDPATRHALLQRDKLRKRAERAAQGKPYQGEVEAYLATYVIKGPS